MTGFCKDCGEPLSRCLCNVAEKTSPDVDMVPLKASPPVPRSQSIGPLPKPNTPRRLFGSGIEFVAYAICNSIISTLDLFSGGLLGLWHAILIALIVLRDFNGGAFNIAKRVSSMRVVDLNTGRAASNFQALVRNGYYLLLLGVSLVLPLVDLFTFALFLMFIFLDAMMILVSRYGRRLGDLMAGTQVVEAEP